MITTLVDIGNSRGVRIPKPLLSESGLEHEVELKVKKGEIRIVPAPSTKKQNIKVQDTTLLSEKALGIDWNKPEEDIAWASIQ